MLDLSQKGIFSYLCLFSSIFFLILLFFLYFLFLRLIEKGLLTLLLKYNKVKMYVLRGDDGLHREGEGEVRGGGGGPGGGLLLPNPAAPAPPSKL